MVKKLESLSYKVFVIVSFALLRSSYFIFLISITINLFLTMFTQLPFLTRHEKVTCFMKFSVNGKKNLKIFHTSFSSLFRLRCYGQVTSISYVHFRSLFLTNFTQTFFFKSTRQILLVSWNFPRMVKKTNEIKFSYKFLVFISIALLRSSYFNFLRSFQIILF